MARRGRFFETPNGMGCCLAVSRDLYEQLGGFDCDMRFWGSEDVDFGLKSWLMGYSMLHDPSAVVGHRFQAGFQNYSVPEPHILANRIRTARKHFTDPVWFDWLERRRTEHSPADWPAGWSLFCERRESAETERHRLLESRVHDEFWYAAKFGLRWPAALSAAKIHDTPPRSDTKEEYFRRHARRPYHRRIIADTGLIGTVPSSTAGPVTVYVRLCRSPYGLISVSQAGFDCGDCEATIACASLLAQEIEGKPLDAVRLLSAAELADRFPDSADIAAAAETVATALRLALSRF